jgi:hypothetical protein
VKKLIEGLQEKFQTQQPLNRNDEQAVWATDKSARVKKGTPGREGRPGGDQTSKRINNAVMFGSLPPGTDMEDQELTDQRKMPMVMSGESDVSKDYSKAALGKGFTPRPMSATDDEYSNQHDDAFYDDLGGFVERNNMLDRL